MQRTDTCEFCSTKNNADSESRSIFLNDSIFLYGLLPLALPPLLADRWIIMQSLTEQNHEYNNNNNCCCRVGTLPSLGHAHTEPGLIARVSANETAGFHVNKPFGRRMSGCTSELDGRLEHSETQLHPMNQSFHIKHRRWINTTTMTTLHLFVHFVWSTKGFFAAKAKRCTTFVPSVSITTHKLPCKRVGVFAWPLLVLHRLTELTTT